MSTAHAVLFQGEARTLHPTRVAVPQPQGCEILVRVLGCTLCGSDLHTVEGHRQVPVPTILGHEMVGEIAAFGSSASRHAWGGDPLTVGTRVTWAIVAHCGDCFYCTRQLPQKCLQAVKYGHEVARPGHELTGGLAEYCLLAPGTTLVRLPDHLTLAAACPANCATATVAAAWAAAGELQHRTVCVLGAGMLGLTACAMARYHNASQVVCVDPVETRRKLALAFGATHVAEPAQAGEQIAQLTQGQGCDVICDVSGSTSATQAAVGHLRMGGRLILVGAVYPTPPLSLSPETLVRRQLTVQGIHNYAPQHLGAAVEFLAQSVDRFPFDQLVAAWHPLSDVETAFAEARQSHAIRVGIMPSAIPGTDLPRE